MHRCAQILFLFLIFCQCVVAQEVAITIDGESFTGKFVGKSPNGDKLLEFVRKSETFENWTKLVGYRYQQLPVLGNDPKKAAAEMEQIVKKTNPQAQSRVIANEKANEALIDFLTWPPSHKYMEFNIFRYVKSLDGKAVVSLQLAYRFKDFSTAEDVEKFKKIRAAWINQAVAFDMNKVHSALAK